MLQDKIFGVDLPYHSKVRWLSQGQVFEKILFLREKKIDLNCKNNQNCKLSDMNFFQNAASLCNIMSKPNKLNTFFQGRNESLYDMRQKNFRV